MASTFTSSKCISSNKKKGRGLIISNFNWSLKENTVAPCKKVSRQRDRKKSKSKIQVLLGSRDSDRRHMKTVGRVYYIGAATVECASENPESGNTKRGAVLRKFFHFALYAYSAVHVVTDHVEPFLTSGKRPDDSHFATVDNGIRNESNNCVVYLTFAM